MDTLSIGPLAIPLDRLFVLLGVVGVFALAWWLERRRGVDAGLPLWCGLIAGIVVGRAAYASARWDWYQDNPVTVLFFWQEGYAPVWGMAAALLVAALVAWRRQIPVLVPSASLLAGFALWGALAFGHGLVSDGPAGSLPERQLTSLEGERLELAGLEGKPVVINLWASWCPPCRREMPAFEQAQARYGDEVHFLFPNQGESREEMEAWLAAEGLELDGVLLDKSSSLSGEVGAHVLPTTLFYDADGKLRDAHVGEVSSARLADYVESLK